METDSEFSRGIIKNTPMFGSLAKLNSEDKLVDFLDRLDQIQIPNSSLLDSIFMESSNSNGLSKKKNCQCSVYAPDKSANFSIISKDFVFHGEVPKNKSEFFKLNEKEYFFFLGLRHY